MLCETTGVRSTNAEGVAEGLNAHARFARMSQRSDAVFAQLRYRAIHLRCILHLQNITYNIYNSILLYITIRGLRILQD